MNYLDVWKRRKIAERAEIDKRSAIDRVIEDRQTDLILEILERFGITRESIQTNKYWFKFEHNGFIVKFVNQTSRLCGAMYRKPRNKDEELCIQDAVSIRHTDEYDMFRKEFLYEHFIFEGVPAGVYNVISLLTKNENS